MRRTRIGISAVLLGVGLGGMLDGIVLGRLLQAQHALLWGVSVGGVALLWSAFRSPGRTPTARGFVAYALVGWSGFNIAHGLVERNWVMLLAGIGLMLFGLALRDPPDPGPISAERRSGYDRRTGLSA